MVYRKTKIYSDGSHYIGIPNELQPHKKRKNISKTQKNENEEKVKAIYKSCKEKTRKEKIEKTIELIDKEINDKEKSIALVNKVLEKEKRNKTVRMTRLYRKINLQQWNYFCTFTYDNNKLKEQEFRTKLLYCLRHLSNRKGWKYIGVFERSIEKERLHFHGLFVIKEMIGNLEEKKDYSLSSHKMQIANQNTYFLERFGRNDFKLIENNIGVNDSVKYMLKYIQKSGEKIIYSKHLQTYFITDILEDDVICSIGQEDRKLLLFDNFLCLDTDTGEVFGNVNNEVIDKMPKAY